MLFERDDGGLSIRHQWVLPEVYAIGDFAHGRIGSRVSQFEGD